MKQVWKKRAVVLTVLVFVGAAIYLNWRYTDQIRDPKILGQSTLVSGQENNAAEEVSKNDYFATARLSRKQARDNAISMLEDAEKDVNADQSVLNEASETLQVLAAYTVAEAQIENLVTAKGYSDCITFMGDDSVSVVVADADGLDATDVARIMDIVLNETDYTADQVKIMESN